VASRTSAFAFKGKPLSVREVGAALNVQAVLEGSVRREGNAMRITAQLADVDTGYQLWSGEYDREQQNLFAVEEELARSIVQTLRPQLSPRDAPATMTSTTRDPVAHDAYLQGRYFWNKRTADALKTAITYFQRAIDRDPQYALAYVGIADATSILCEYGSEPTTNVLPRAKAAALKALEIEPRLAEAHASLGLISQYDFDWKAAESETRRAVELKPEYPTAHHWYSLVLVSLGRTAEAVTEAERARQLDPTSLVINNMLTTALVAARQYDRAIASARKTLELDPGFLLGRQWLAKAYLGKEMYAEAITELEKIRDSSLAVPGRYASELGFAYAMGGHPEKARELLVDLERRSLKEYVLPTIPAIIYMGLGDKERAFAWFEKGVQDKAWKMREMNVYPLFDSLRSDPRFQSLMDRMNVPRN